MRCEYCEFAIQCNDPASLGGGCDIDGVDDFGCGTLWDDEAIDNDNSYEEIGL